MPVNLLDFPVNFGDSGYNSQFIIEKLNVNSKEFQSLVDKNHVRNVTADPIGFGFTSKVYKVQFEFTNGSRWSCILKVPSWDMLIETGLKDTLPDNVCELAHQTECRFFELVKDFPNMPIPTLYYTEQETGKRSGCILMQDFSDTAIVVHGHVHVPEGLCVNVAKAVAKFQASAQRIDKESLKAFDNTEFLFRAMEKMFKESLPQDAVKEGVDGDQLQKMMFLINTDFIEYTLYGVAKEHNALGPVHGDLHGNNMLVYKNEDESMSDEIAAFIDWQGFYQSNPLTDLSRFMTNMVDSDVRRGLGDRIVDIYYDTLIEEFEKIGKKVNFSRKTAQILYEITFIYHTLYAAVIPRFHRHLAAKAGPEGANERIATVVLRANHMLEDALPLIAKYQLQDRFGA